jgi:RHS repeat-associated protein
VTDAGGLLNGIAHQAVYTAFGELVSSSGDGGRYGFAGAWGYASGTWDNEGGACDSGNPSQSCDPLAALGWLHVGARYYDPQSGRFVQRDPIGIAGGLNTYEYVKNRPSSETDASGLFPGADDLIEVGGIIGGAGLLFPDPYSKILVPAGGVLIGAGSAAKFIERKFFPPVPPPPPPPPPPTGPMRIRPRPEDREEWRRIIRDLEKRGQPDPPPLSEDPAFELCMGARA